MADWPGDRLQPAAVDGKQVSLRQLASLALSAV